MEGTEKTQFRLLGIYVDQIDEIELKKISAVGRAENKDDYLKDIIENFFNYQKVLKEGYFPLISSVKFESSTNGNLIFQKLQLNEGIYDDGRLKIELSAIVGQNGSGKTTLLEIIYLMIYNLSVKYEVLNPTYPNSNEAKKYYMPYLKSKLIFQYEDSFYLINFNITQLSRSSENNSISFHKGINKGQFINFDLSESFNFSLDKFAYFISMNYSIYGSNHDMMGNWIQQLFHKNDGYQTPIVLNPYREHGLFNVNRELQLAVNRLLSNVIFMANVNANQFEPLPGYSFERVDFIYTKDTSKIKRSSPLFSYILDCLANKEKVKKRTPYTYLNDLEDEGFIESSQFYSVNDFFSISLESNKAEITHILNFILTDYFKDQSLKIAALRIDLFNELIEYIIYKIYKIGITYREFFPKLIEPKTNKFSSLVVCENSVLSDLFKDSSHITLKLRQAISTLYNINNFTENKIFDMSQSGSNKESYEHFCITKHFTIKSSRYSFNRTKLSRYAEKMNKPNFVHLDDLTQIPPSFLDPIILLKKKHKKKEDKNEIQLLTVQSLSSGELQFLVVSQTILYHLINLHSVNRVNSKIKKYKHVTILLDEIELYFHPEYQRLFTSKLLKLLRNYQETISDIYSLHIIYSTHSPFILSDIPSQNILKLKDGKPVLDKNGKNSFAANIHDLLNDEFFLENGTMGEFAKGKIEEILANKIVDKADVEVIELIGDPFLKGVLKSKVREKLSKEAIDLEIEKLNWLKNKFNDSI